MVRCWKRSENRLEEECTDGGPEASPRSHFPHKAFWVGLSASLLLVILALGLMGHFGRSQSHSQSLQTVRFTVPDQIGALINQSAVVDQQNELVTFSVTSPINRTSTVLFDIKHSLICYKPIDQESCFLRKMESSDYTNVNSLLHESTPKLYPQSTAPLSQDLLVLRDFVGMPYKERGEAYRALKSLIVCLSYSTAEFLSTPDPFSPLGVLGIFLQEATAASPSPGLGTMAALCEGFSTFKSQFQLSGNETQRQTEFLGVLAASQVNVSSLEEPLQALCQDRSVHWTRRTEGPGKQRLVYFCIDICFPSNICVSVCFYYLPE